MIYLLTAIGLSPGGSSTVHIYTQTVHRTTQDKQYIEQHKNLGECGPCPVLARFTLAFALQLRKKHGKTSVRVAASKNTAASKNMSLKNPVTPPGIDPGTVRLAAHSLNHYVTPGPTKLVYPNNQEISYCLTKIRAVAHKFTCD